MRLILFWREPVHAVSCKRLVCALAHLRQHATCMRLRVAAGGRTGIGPDFHGGLLLRNVYRKRGKSFPFLLYAHSTKSIQLVEPAVPDMRKECVDRLLQARMPVFCKRGIVL